MHPNLINTALPRVPVELDSSLHRFVARIADSIGIGEGQITANQLQTRGFRFFRSSVPADETIAEAGRLIGVTSSGVTLTIASSAATDGAWLLIKDESGAAGTASIVVATEGDGLIDGGETLEISTNYGYVLLYSDGTDWFVISGN